MSQTTWTQKTPVKEMSEAVDIQQGLSGAVSSSGSETQFSSSPRHFTIPINANSKNYTMEEVFQAWYDNREKILAASVKDPKTVERYRASVPSPIYHLDLQSQSKTESASEITQGIRDVNIEDSSTAQSIQEAIGEANPVPVASNDVSDSQNSSPFITPENIEWFYVDPSGNEQGPFNGAMMQDWLNEGYLAPDLNVRRKEEPQFRTLKELCSQVQNFAEPFKVPLPDLSYAQAGEGLDGNYVAPSVNVDANVDSKHSFPQFLSGQPNTLGAATMINTAIGSQPNLFGGEFIQKEPFSAALSSQPNVFVAPQNNQFIDTINPNLNFNGIHSINGVENLLQTQPSVLSRANSSWGIDPAGVAPTLPSQITQPAPLSPWVSSVQTHSRVSSPFVPSSNLNSTSNENSPYRAGGSIEDHVLEGLQSSVLTGILNDNEEVPKPFHEPVADVPQNTNKFEKNSQEKVLPVSGGPKTVEVEVQNNEVSGGMSKPQEKATTVKKVLKTTPENPPVAKQPQLAPWASASKESRPEKNLKEIQKLEAEELEKQKKAELEQRQQALLNQKQDASAKLSYDTAPAVGSGLPRTSSWAGSTPAVTPTKSLADIQREETEAKLKLSKASNGNGGVKMSIASTLANSGPKDDNEWTTVAPKKQPPKKTIAQIVNTSSGASRTSPRVLRSVSASQPNSPSINPAALKEDFLVWARSSMTNMYPTVSKDDLLDIFVSLPSTSSDSSQLISETIYSSSATMDGRRFADEFLKRKHKVESQVGGNVGDWSSVIASSANKTQIVDEEGWSTNIKSKKKGKKI